VALGEALQPQPRLTASSQRAPLRWWGAGACLGERVGRITTGSAENPSRRWGAVKTLHSLASMAGHSCQTR